MVDLIPGRTKEILTTYFKQFPRSTLNQVKVVVIDMSETYLIIAKMFFRRAKIVIDKFHVVMSLTDAVAVFRKRRQQEAAGCKKLYYQLRHTIGKRRADLTPDQKAQLDELCARDHELKVVYELKEQFHNIYDKPYDRGKAKEKLAAWAKMAQRSDIPELQGFVKTFERRQEHILNYFDCRYTNGLIEGLNNRNKVIQRLSYGFKRWDILRGKLMFELSGCG